MQKWEYLFVTSNFNKYGKKFYRENGEELEFNGALFEYLNKRGGEGWEAVSIKTEQSYDTLVLKRPIEAKKSAPKKSAEKKTSEKKTSK